jgi:phenylpropionate dioxygenase-like ring-hydroxylating dioxygenase large terminal subunit
MKDERYELSLCDALMEAMGTGIAELDGLAAALNRTDVRPLTADRWDAQLLHGELRRIGNPPPKAPCASPLVFKRHAVPEAYGEASRPADAGSGPDLQRTVEHLLQLGIRNRWYCVAASRELGDKPLALTALGEKLVLWRDGEGRVRALEDRCPHRGMALSVGSVYEGRLRCAYHGIELDGNGTVVDVPAFPSCAYSGKKMLRDYPALEHYEGIWVWFGDERNPDPPPLELPPELTAPEWSGRPYVDVWPANYQYVYDNVCDPMHGSYLHRSTYTHAYGAGTDTIRVKDTGHGFEVFREGQQGIAFDWMEFIDAGACQYMRIKIPFPASAGPGGNLQVVFFVTPVDRNTTKVVVWRLRKVSGWHEDLWHFLYSTRVGTAMAGVLNQDRDALKAMPPWPAPENLYQHDIGVVRARRHMRQLAEAQASALPGA